MQGKTQVLPGVLFCDANSHCPEQTLPKFISMLSSLPDYRKAPDYKTDEVLMAAIAIFLFKRGSRNSMDNLSRKGRFAANYERIFGCRFPDTGTCDKLLRKLPPEGLERLK